jgi:hypothetical protein
MLKVPSPVEDMFNAVVDVVVAAVVDVSMVVDVDLGALVDVVVVDVATATVA